MKFPQGAFERTAHEVKAGPLALFECGVCWQLYDPTEGDPVAQVPAGTSFADLPEQWRCPGCEAAKERFLLVDESHD